MGASNVQPIRQGVQCAEEEFIGGQDRRGVESLDVIASFPAAMLIMAETFGTFFRRRSQSPLHDYSRSAIRARARVTQERASASLTLPYGGVSEVTRKEERCRFAQARPPGMEVPPTNPLAGGQTLELMLN